MTWHASSAARERAPPRPAAWQQPEWAEAMALHRSESETRHQRTVADRRQRKVHIQSRRRQAACSNKYSLFSPSVQVLGRSVSKAVKRRTSSVDFSS
jgi:hypothetical protein